MGESALRKDISNSDIPALCVSCEARHKGVCGVLTPEELTALSKHTSKSTHTPGREIVGETQPVTSYANVMRGVVKLSKMLEDGRQQVVGLKFAPDLLGRPFSQNSDVTAEAASEVETCNFPKVAFESLMKENVGLEHRVLQQTLKELDEARDWMLTLGRKTASEKVASFLYLIATHMDPELDVLETGTTQFTLPMNRSDIADFLGLTVETVSRQITKLRTEKIIDVVVNRQVSVPNLHALRNRCG
jgi:CRP/FNR family transcriptional regulator